MKVYRAQFTGRTLGAIGIFYPIETTCHGNDEEEAKVDLYKRYEQLSGLRLTLIGETDDPKK